MRLDIKNRGLPAGYLVNRDGFACRKSTNGTWYCGRRVLVGTAGCDGYCGPNDGPQCYACARIQDGNYDELL